MTVLLPSALIVSTAAETKSETRRMGSTDIRPIVSTLRTVDLEVGEKREVELPSGVRVSISLLALDELRDPIRQAIREARVQVEVNGVSVSLSSGNYHLPVTVPSAGVQIDCPITRGYASNSNRGNIWALENAARIRVWPAGAPLMEPGTFSYPLRQRWFASSTQMANEPVFVDGGERPERRVIYYHYGLDFGGAEGLVDVIAATDGLVVTAAGEILPGYADSPARPRYDAISLLDDRGWYYRYSHLAAIDVKAGQRVRRGERLGLLGKEGASGGWSHLHFDITSRQPNGKWGIQDGYAYVWEAFLRENNPQLIAVARPHRLATVGDEVSFDARKSWSLHGDIARYEWRFTDGSTASGPTAKRTYRQPGTYSEVLQVTDRAGNRSWDFSQVQVLDLARAELPPTIHASYYPTTGLKAGDEITFMVRTFRTAPTGETWHFGDGSPAVNVKSDANAAVHAKEGYAVTTHRYARPGNYIARVEHVNARNERAIAHLWVEVK